jgi:hypothetical protein
MLAENETHSYLVGLKNSELVATMYTLVHYVRCSRMQNSKANYAILILISSLETVALNLSSLPKP